MDAGKATGFDVGASTEDHIVNHLNSLAAGSGGVASAVNVRSGVDVGSGVAVASGVAVGSSAASSSPVSALGSPDSEVRALHAYRSAYPQTNNSPGSAPSSFAQSTFAPPSFAQPSFAQSSFNPPPPSSPPSTSSSSTPLPSTPPPPSTRAWVSASPSTPPSPSAYPSANVPNNSSPSVRPLTRRLELQAAGPVSWGQVIRFGANRGEQPQREHEQDAANHIALVLCTAGSARYQCANQIHHVRPATISWSVPALRSEFVDATTEYEAWVAQVSGSLVQRMGLMGQQRQGAALSRRLTVDGAKRLESHFEYLASLDNGSDQFHVGMEYLLLSAWAEQHRTTRVDELIDIHPAVEKAAHILRHQPETSSLRELAQACNASASWLSRLFREQLGVSLVGYRNQARIERFFELYGTGRDANLTEAALGAGFGSYAQFHRVFKDTLGFAPGDLKRGVRGAIESIR